VEERERVGGMASKTSGVAESKVPEHSKEIGSMRFRKKPILIQAVQWFPPEDNRHDANSHPVGCDPGAAMVGTIVKQPWDNTGGHAYSIKTLEGWAELTTGDWIITGIKGEKYPCKPDIFEATYEAAPHVVMVCGVHCHPGDSVCNNYCNSAPQKGPMAATPPPGPDAKEIR